MHHKLIAMAIAALCASGAAAAVPAEDIRSLLGQNKYSEACQLGRQHSEELGNPAFDLNYGIACVDGGHPSEGVLALERYLLNFPNNAHARLGLARGYFVLGEDLRAREEFSTVSKLNPPADTQATIERYVDAIREREGNYQKTARFYVEGGVGSDSNVNGGIGNANIDLPVLGNVQVNANGVRKGDTFNHAAVGGQITMPVAPGVSVLGGASIDSKLNQSAKSFDMETVSALGGVSVRRGKEVFRFTGAENSLAVGHNHFLDITGITGEWLHPLDETQTVNGFIQHANLDYYGSNQVRDTRLVGVGGAYRKAFAVNWQPVLTTTMSYSDERNLHSRPDLGRDMLGVTLGIAASPHPQWNISAGYSYQQSHYGGADITTNVTRHDENHTLNLGAVYFYDRNISIRGEIAVSDNKSNLALFRYQRTVGSINLRYDFK